MLLKFWKKIRIKKIRTRFLLAMVLLVTVSIPALGYASYEISAAIIENNHAASYLSSLETSNEVVENILENIVNSTRTFLYDQEFLQTAASLPGENDTPLERLNRDNLIRQDIERFTFYIGEISWACFYDRNGTQYSHGTRKNMLNVALGSTYDRVRLTDWFRQIEQAKGREVFFSYDVLDSANPDGLFTCGKVINRTDTYEPLGVLLVFIKKDIFKPAFPSRTGSLEDCYLIADMESGKVRNLVYGTNPGFDVAVEEGIVEPGYFSEQNGFLTTSFVNQKTGWQMIHAVRMEDLLRDTGQIKRYTVLVTAAMLALAIILFFLLSRSIEKPLSRLERVIGEVGRGRREFDERFDSDEIGVIGNHFLDMIAENYSLHEKMAQLRLKQKEAELSRLQAEINPHFLYNTLDSIYWMAAVKGVPEIGAMAVALSKVFRISLNSGGEETTVRREMEQVENYMVIQGMRFQNRLKYSIRADESVLDCTIIKIILQPFVENAVLHGLEPKPGGGNLVVRAIDQGDFVCFIVEDDGVGMELAGSPPAGYGIQNVLDRVELYYGGRGRVEFESHPGKGTRVTVRIPKQRAEKEGTSC